MFLFCSRGVKWPKRASRGRFADLVTRLRQWLRQSAEALAKAEREARRGARRPIRLGPKDGAGTKTISGAYAYSQEYDAWVLSSQKDPWC
jgi:hypothetical protein